MLIAAIVISVVLTCLTVFLTGVVFYLQRAVDEAAEAVAAALRDLAAVRSELDGANWRADIYAKMLRAGCPETNAIFELYQRQVADWQDESPAWPRQLPN